MLNTSFNFSFQFDSDNRTDFTDLLWTVSEKKKVFTKVLWKTAPVLYILCFGTGFPKNSLKGRLFVYVIRYTIEDIK